MSTPVGVVIITRDRRDSLMRTLRHLAGLHEQPPVVVVDNGSRDGTPQAVREQFPGVDVIEAGRNLGSAGRTAGVRRLTTPYVAFADDDSWWESGSLARAASVLDAFPRAAVLAARMLVGEEGRDDPTNVALAGSPLPREPDLPGPAVLGFIACGAVVRRSAYLEVGGFHPRYGVGGEERLLATDLAVGGWGLTYCPDVVARHHPSPARDAFRRAVHDRRNDLWTVLLRRRLPTVLRATVATVGAAGRDRAVRTALVETIRALPWLVAERRAVPAALERRLLLLDHAERQRVTAAPAAPHAPACNGSSDAPRRTTRTGSSLRPR